MWDRMRPLLVELLPELERVPVETTCPANNVE